MVALRAAVLWFEIPVFEGEFEREKLCKICDDFYKLGREGVANREIYMRVSFCVRDIRHQLAHILSLFSTTFLFVQRHTLSLFQCYTVSFFRVTFSLCFCRLSRLQLLLIPVIQLGIYNVVTLWLGRRDYRYIPNIAATKWFTRCKW